MRTARKKTIEAWQEITVQRSVSSVLFAADPREREVKIYRRGPGGRFGHQERTPVLDAGEIWTPDILRDELAATGWPSHGVKIRIHDVSGPELAKELALQDPPIVKRANGYLATQTFQQLVIPDKELKMVPASASAPAAVPAPQSNGHWVKDFFLPKDGGIEALLGSLERLMTVTIPMFVDIYRQMQDAKWEAREDYVERRLQGVTRVEQQERRKNDLAMKMQPSIIPSVGAARGGIGFGKKRSKQKQKAQVRTYS